MFIDYLDHLRSLGRWYFTFKQIVEELKISINSAKSGLYRMKKEGRLITPAKGLYVIVPPEHQPYGCIPAEDLVPILMSHLKADYYVSLLSGAQYYGAAHQKSGRFQVVSNIRLKQQLKFGQIKIELTFKKSLNALPTQDFKVRTGFLKVATPEVVVLDLLSNQKKSGGLNHIATILSELIDAIDPGKLIRLAEIFEEKAWLQRLGYILEQIDPMETKKTHEVVQKLQQYLRGKLKTYIPLACEMPKAGFPRIKKWLIIANTDIESDV